MPTLGELQADGYSVTPQGLGTLRSYRPSENVIDRRRRGAGDYEQRMNARVNAAHAELQTGLPEGVTPEMVEGWLYKNDPAGETFGQAAAEASVMPTPLPGYSQAVQPIYGVTDQMYQRPQYYFGR